MGLSRDMPFRPIDRGMSLWWKLGLSTAIIVGSKSIFSGQRARQGQKWPCHFCMFQLIIVEFHNYLGLKICEILTALF